MKNLFVDHLGLLRPWVLGVCGIASIIITVVLLMNVQRHYDEIRCFFIYNCR